MFCRVVCSLPLAVPTLPGPQVGWSRFILNLRERCKKHKKVVEVVTMPPARLLEAEVADATPALSLLPLALANRTLLLTGDSVTRDTFHVLVRLIATPHEPRTRHINPVGNLVSCHVWKSAFRLCLTEAGGDGGEPLKRQADGSLNRSECLRPHAGIGWWSINPSDVFACLAEMQVIGDDSVVISNFGLHHNNLGSLQRNVKSFLAWRHASPTRPCIVWRETTPQHFASSDGTFQHGNGPWRTSDPLGRAPCCARLNHTELAGQHQRFNEMSTPMLLRAGVHVARVWAALAAHWDLHGPMNATGCVLRRINEDMRRGAGTTVDCVHWHDKASAWLGLASVAAALQACPAVFRRKLSLREPSFPDCRRRRRRTQALYTQAPRRVIELN